MSKTGMKGRATGEHHFKTCMLILRYVASQHPRRVSYLDIEQILPTKSRSSQKTILSLVDMGYLRADGLRPQGFRLVKGVFKEFQL